MSKLFISTPETRSVEVFNGDLHSVWYKLIELIGLPVDTEGVLVDSIAKLQQQQAQGNIGTACFTKNTSNYRTNKIWYKVVA